MPEKSFISLIVILGFALTPLPAVAKPVALSTHCRTVVDEVSKVSNRYALSLFTQAYKLPLSSEAAVEVLSHPGLMSLSKELNEGQNLELSVWPSGRDKETVSLYKGETIQAEYIRKILKLVFPRARFGPHDGDNTQKISLAVGDSAECCGTNDKALQMLDLKPANGSAEGISKVETRTALGLLSSDKVVHLYQRYLDIRDSLDPDLYLSPERAWSALNEKIDVSVLIISSSSSPSLNLFLRKLEGSAYGHPPLYFLSKIKKRGLEKVKRPFWIINDTRGFMPYLYAASDLAVITGPINIFEALTVKTPTINFYNLLVKGHYDDDAFKRAQSVALSSGGFETVDRVDKLGVSAENLMGVAHDITPPYRQIAPGMQRSSFEKLLDLLTEQLRAQLVISKISAVGH